ncbi:glycosyltransferase [Synechococcus elongatus IITB4]|uniref:glycosyltransferase n=1 Tax=Synechococcus elongatus TaxID=32046 RepID=UPI0030D28431
MIKVIHVNASDNFGGAARAAYRIHRALVEHTSSYDLTSTMRVIQQFSTEPAVIAGSPCSQSPLWRRLQPRLTQRCYKGFQTNNFSLHSVAWPNTGLGRELSKSDADIIHLHWLGNSTLSIEEIGQLKKPIIWRLPDMWAFCGAEHYTYDAAIDQRYIEGYYTNNRPSWEKGKDLNRWVWERKYRAWKSPIQIVCTTQWMVQCVRRSLLMREWPISIIPNCLDLNNFAPLNSFLARQLLNLPNDRPLILFGAIGGMTDPRKGADLLLLALQRLQQKVEDSTLANLELVIFGQSQPAQPPRLGFPIHYVGRLQDDLSLRLLYAAADVMVVPSRQEAFGQTASEAQACGTPVVAFRTGGLVDVVDDRVTGVLADPFDPESLAQAIHWVLADRERQQKLREQARSRAEKLWNPAIVAAAYTELYQQAIAERTSL